MLKKALPLSLISLALVGTASAQFDRPDEDFCTRQAPCVMSRTSNQSQKTMKSVTITQQPTNGACTKVKRKIDRKLRSYEDFRVKVNPTCKYTIEFNAGSGCKGDKKAYLTPEKFKERRVNAHIKGKCDHLKTSVTRY